MDNPLKLKVSISYHSLPATVLKIVIALLILPFSLLLYLAGLILTITIIGSVIGIPLILSTYVLDALALSSLMNPKEKIVKVSCPDCGKGKFIMPSSMKEFRCNRCGGLVEVETTTNEMYSKERSY